MPGQDPEVVAAAWKAAGEVQDPELPGLTISDLGMIRDIRIEDERTVVSLTPTYSGCPAQFVIESAVVTALRVIGHDPKVVRVLDPPWTTDWITDRGRRKLLESGIAPPENESLTSSSLFARRIVHCPRCGSQQTERISEFGSTACKALYRCTACLEPFDYFKCI